MATLKELVNECGSNGFVFADAGNGSSIGEEGRFVTWDDAAEAEYGDVELQPLDAPHRSVDGAECGHASDWVESGGGANPYRYRIYF
jgi:hypothetical protein